MSTPDWLKIGAEVVSFTPAWNSGGGGGSIRSSVVEKIGKRDVVLADGTRFNVNRLSISRGDWRHDTLLLPADDPQVTRARVENRIGHTYSALRRVNDEVETAVRNRKSAGLPEAVDELRTLTTALLALEAELAALP